MNHSPGPWKMGPRIHHEMFASIFGADGQLIVNLGDGGNGIERQTANAELIVKAPDLLAENAKLLLQVDELQKKLLKVAVHCDFPEEVLGRPCGNNDETCKCRCAQCMLAKQKGRGELFVEKRKCQCGSEWPLRAGFHEGPHGATKCPLENKECGVPPGRCYCGGCVM